MAIIQNKKIRYAPSIAVAESHKSGWEDGMEIQIPDAIIDTSTTMKTSTLPAIDVPAITAADINLLYSAFSNGVTARIKATISSVNSTHAVLSCDKDNSVTNITIMYHNYIVTYDYDGTNVVATYTQLS